MEKKTTEFVYIIDRSRSMHGKEKEIIERFNHWLTQQKQKKSPFLVTLALCNEECELLYCRMPLKYVKPLDTFTYYTKGYTAYTDRAEEVLDLVCDLMPPAERQEVSLHQTGWIILAQKKTGQSSTKNWKLWKKRDGK